MNNEIKEILREAKEFQYIDLNIEETDLLLDYITNLQEENERLKEENKHIFSKVNDDKLLISNAMNYAEAQDYKSRCEKAIEYIKEWQSFPHTNCTTHNELKNLMNILGDDKSE